MCGLRTFVAREHLATPSCRQTERWNTRRVSLSNHRPGRHSDSLWGISSPAWGSYVREGELRGRVKVEWVPQHFRVTQSDSALSSAEWLTIWAARSEPACALSTRVGVSTPHPSTIRCVTRDSLQKRKPIRAVSKDGRHHETPWQTGSFGVKNRHSHRPRRRASPVLAGLSSWFWPHFSGILGPTHPSRFGIGISGALSDNDAETESPIFTAQRATDFHKSTLFLVVPLGRFHLCRPNQVPRVVCR